MIQTSKALIENSDGVYERLLQIQRSGERERPLRLRLNRVVLHAFIHMQRESNKEKMNESNEWINEHLLRNSKQATAKAAIWLKWKLD